MQYKGRIETIPNYAKSHVEEYRRFLDLGEVIRELVSTPAVTDGNYPPLFQELCNLRAEWKRVEAHLFSDYKPKSREYSWDRARDSLEMRWLRTRDTIEKLQSRSMGCREGGIMTNAITCIPISVTSLSPVKRGYSPTKFSLTDVLSPDDFAWMVQFFVVTWLPKRRSTLIFEDGRRVTGESEVKCWLLRRAEQRRAEYTTRTAEGWRYMIVVTEYNSLCQFHFHINPVPTYRKMTMSERKLR